MTAFKRIPKDIEIGCLSSSSIDADMIDFKSEQYNYITNFKI